MELLGGGRTFDLLGLELSAENGSALGYKRESDLRIVVTEKHDIARGYNPQVSSAKNHMHFDRNHYYYDQPVPYVCEDLFTTETCELRLGKPPRSLKSFLRDLRTVDSYSSPEASYAILWYVVQALLLQRGFTFIHAGIVARDGRATAFVGTGGSGKTSLLFDYLSDTGNQYVSEDFGILSRTGQVMHCSKTLSIYASDLMSGSRLLQERVKALPAFNTLKWKAFSGVLRRNPMAKVPVAAFFAPDEICETAVLDRAIHLVRTDLQEPVLVSASVTDFADRMTWITLREMKTLVEVLNLIAANAPNDFAYPTVIDLANSIRETYLEGLREVDTLLLQVPFRSKPHEIRAFLSAQGL